MLSPQTKKKWKTNKETINVRYEITDAQTKKNWKRGTALERSVGKLLWVGWLQLVLLTRNLALNSDAIPSYKYMFGPYRGPLPHLWTLFTIINPIWTQILIFFELKFRANALEIKLGADLWERFQIWDFHRYLCNQMKVYDFLKFHRIIKLKSTALLYHTDCQAPNQIYD